MTEHRKTGSVPAAAAAVGGDASAAASGRRRRVGLGLATAVVASNMVGGIYLLPATLAPVGSITTLGWLLAAAGALVVGRVLGRLGRYQPAAGGACAYAGRSLGRFMGYETTAVYWVACWSGNIAIALVAIGYLASLAPGLASPVHITVAAIGFIWLMTAANVTSPRLICQMESVALAVGMVPILIVLVGGWWHFRLGVFQAGWNPTGAPIAHALPPALVLMFWAFVGLESASIGTAFVENPERNVGRATTYGILLAAAIYILSCGLIMGIIPVARLAHSTAPFADAVALIFGPAAGALVALAALVKAVGSLGAWILLTTETGESGAERGDFPTLFARRSRRGLPMANLLLVAVITSVGVALSTSPTLGEQFGKIISVSVNLTLLLYVFACLSVWPAARRVPGLRAERGWAAAGIIFCLAVIGWSGAPMLVATAVALALINLFYPLWRRHAAEAKAA
ncbi:MAG: amino acid permease [Terriglobales bacterium]